VQQYDGRYFVNPGSVTGAYSGLNSAPHPSFALFQVQGEDMTCYVYELQNDQVAIRQLDIQIKK
jgi:vacuolar protein sorting-associated protein 29